MQKLPLEIQHVINYLRRSRQDEEREKRTGEDTLSEQKALMDRVLSQYADITYDQRQEIGSGDKIETRPVFREIVEELRAGKYDAVVVKEISRLGRGSYTDMGTIYDLIQQNRIYIITPYKVYDPRNNADLRQIRFELFLSREEFETTRERLMGSRYSYAMSGKWMAGSVPYGYTFDSQSQRLIPNDEEAKIVQLIFQLYVNGLSGRRLGYQAISSYLEKIGVPSPTGTSTWHVQTIRRTLLRKAYVGCVEFRKTERQGKKQVERPETEWIVVEDAHEPIVDTELFDAAQELMNKRKPAVKLDFSPCELAGIVTCGKCGRKMVRQCSTQHYRKQDGSVSVYEKEFLWCPTGCGSVKYRDVESLILTSLERVTQYDDDTLRVYLQQTVIPTKPDIDVDQLRQQAEQRKKALQNRLRVAFERLEDGIYSEEDFVTRRDEIRAEIAEIDKAMSTYAEFDEPQEVAIDVSRIREMFRSAVEVYRAVRDKSLRNEILASIIASATLNVITPGKGRRSKEFNVDMKYSV